MPRKSKKADLSGKSSSVSSQLHKQKPVAKMKVSVFGKSITKLEVPRVIAYANPSRFSTIASSIQDDGQEKEDKNLVEKSISGKKKTKREKVKSAEKKRSKEVVQAIDSIWNYLGHGDIDLRYATVGYGFNGRPILDHDIFVNLLINYGFTIGQVLEFIDDFNELSLEDDEFPMVMINSHMEQIYREVRPLGEEEKDQDTKS